MAETDNQEVMSRKAKMLSKLKEKYPDVNIEDEESVYGRISDDYDDYDQKMSKYKADEERLANLFGSDPRSARFLAAWSKGGDPVVMLVKEFGKDILEGLEDPEKIDAIAAANKEYVDRVAKDKAYEEEYNKNIEVTLQGFKELQEEKGYSDDEIDAASKHFIKIAADAIRGIVSKESLEMVMKALNYDTDMEDAERRGEVKGKNAKIDEKLRKMGSGDGTTQMAGKNNMPAKPSGDNRRWGLIDMAMKA
ncbi:MAG: hypothetical protein ACI4T5_02500 [Prevotella sp.]